VAMKILHYLIIYIFSIYSTSALAQERDVKLDELKGNIELLQTSSDIVSGSEVGVYSVNSGGLWTCLGRNSYRWGASPTNAVTIEADLAFRRELEGNEIIKSPSKKDLFAGRENKKFQIAAVIKKLNFNMCFDSKGGKPKGNADLEIEVNIFSKDIKEIIYSKQFSGKFQTEERIDSTQFVIIQRAFAEAINKFISDIKPQPLVEARPIEVPGDKKTYEKARDICLSLGFRLGTDKFSECYLETVKKL